MATTQSKQLQFNAYHRPGILAGDYVLTITPDLKVRNESKTKDLSVLKQSFTIAGERFTLTPNMVKAVFPPEASIGDHSNVLPHIILNRSTLPWERKPDPKQTDQLSLPWLALLVFDEDAGEVPEAKIMTITQFQNPPAPKQGGPTVTGPAIRPKNGPAPAAGVLRLESGQRMDEKVTVIDVAAPLLKQIMPSQADMALLTHVRTAINEQREKEECAVIVANRLPKRGGRTVVHLVSFENQFDTGKFYTLLESGTSGKLIRLISLKSWSFSCLEAYKLSPSAIQVLNRMLPATLPYSPKLLAIGEVTGKENFFTRIKDAMGAAYSADTALTIAGVAVHETFKGLLMHLDRSPSTLRLPKPAGLPGGQAANALMNGSTVLPHYFRNGDSLVSWYHGPLVTADAGVIFRGRTDLQAASLLDADKFIERINNPGADRLAAAIQSGLSTSVKAGIRSAKPVTETALRILIDDLNYLLKTNNFYQFVALPPELAALAAGKPAGEALFMINRLALRYAYPNWILPIAFRFPVFHSDELLLYNFSTGMFDTSYAAAWELGRLLALRDRKFSVDLFNWKKGHSQGTKAAGNTVKRHLPYTVSSDENSLVLPQGIIDWFEQLGRLESIPFNYLVPDEKMLPSESIRFFRIDPAWINCLFDGAFSIGNAGGYIGSQEIILSINRSGLQDQPASGFLLRSDLVTGWPDMQINGYANLIDHDNNVDESLK